MVRFRVEISVTCTVAAGNTVEEAELCEPAVMEFIDHQTAADMLRQVAVQAREPELEELAATVEFLGPRIARKLMGVATKRVG